MKHGDTISHCQTSCIFLPKFDKQNIIRVKKIKYENLKEYSVRYSRSINHNYSKSHVYAIFLFLMSIT